MCRPPVFSHDELVCKMMAKPDLLELCLLFNTQKDSAFMIKQEEMIRSTMEGKVSILFIYRSFYMLDCLNILFIIWLTIFLVCYYRGVMKLSNYHLSGLKEYMLMLLMLLWPHNSDMLYSIIIERNLNLIRRPLYRDLPLHDLYMMTSVP